MQRRTKLSLPRVTRCISCFTGSFSIIFITGGKLPSENKQLIVRFNQPNLARKLTLISASHKKLRNASNHPTLTHSASVPRWVQRHTILMLGEPIAEDFRLLVLAVPSRSVFACKCHYHRMMLACAVADALEVVVETVNSLHRGTSCFDCLE